MTLAEWMELKGETYGTMAAKVRLATRNRAKPLHPHRSTIYKHAQELAEPGPDFVRAYRRITGEKLWPNLA